MRTLTITQLLAAFFVPIAAHAQLIQTLPAGYQSTEGAALDATLFGTSAAQRWHWVYGAGNFSATGPLEITRIELRPDASVASWPAASYPALELDLGRPREYVSMSGSWSDLDAIWDAGSPTPFHRGTFSLPSGVAGGTPQSWVLSFSGAPYVFDPRDERPLVLAWRAPTPMTPPWGALDAASSSSNGATLGNPTSASSSSATVVDRTVVPVVQLHLRPAQAIHAAFRGVVRSIPGLVYIHQSFGLRDLSWTPAAGGIISWEWDFDSDGTVDSTVRDPTVSFATCGPRDVTLRVRDAAGATASVVRRRFFVVSDPFPLRANFTYTQTWNRGICPITRSFQDLSTGAVQSWAWDFESDGIVDSTAQHPVQTVFASGTRRVRLEVRSATCVDRMEQVISDQCNALDECDSVRRSSLIMSSGVVYTLTNREATDSSQGGYCYPAGRDLWLPFTVFPAGIVRVWLCRQSGDVGFSPELQIYTGSCAALVPLLCRSADCGLGGEASFTAFNGPTYFARISDRLGLEGTFQLSIQLSGTSTGTITRPYPGCGGALLAVQGSPDLGQSLQFQIPAQGQPAVLWFGAEAHLVPACEIDCFFAADFHVVVAAPALSVTIPNDPALRFVRVYAQGAILGQSGGCGAGGAMPFVTTDTVQIDVR